MTFQAYFASVALCQLLHPVGRLPGLRRLYRAASEVHLTLLKEWIDGREAE